MAIKIKVLGPDGKPVQLGATGEFPRGQLGPQDEGAIQIGVTHNSEGIVLVNFGKDISWFGMPPQNAIEFAKMIMHHAGVKKVQVIL